MFGFGGDREGTKATARPEERHEPSEEMLEQLRFDPEAFELVHALTDPSLSEEEFRALIADFAESRASEPEDANEMRVGPMTEQGDAESLIFNVTKGREFEVKIYRNRHIEIGEVKPLKPER
ncbi:hypothetical protein HY091_02155 [Candidatus Kaiserbacteria bacterium]|nr:hypothetical protein [Candidatus Kaiserbacteria bacterium]